MVPEKGIEPSRGITPADFESAASTSSATPAYAYKAAIQLAQGRQV